MLLKTFQQNKKLSWFTSIIIAIGIFIISAIPGSGGYGEPNYLAILYHFCAFFFLAFFLNISLDKTTNPKTLTIMSATIWAILDEFHQFFVPGRFMSFGDIITDTAGILLATLIYHAIKKSR